MQPFDSVRSAVNGYRKRQVMRNLRAVADIGNDVNVTATFCLYCRIRDKKQISIGDYVWLDGTMTVQGAGKLKIGNHCSFRRENYLGCMNAIEIGNHVYAAEQVFICDNNNHPISASARKIMTMSPPGTPSWGWEPPGAAVVSAPIRIEDCVWLGRCSMIFKGVTIGRGSIVAAGAVVTKSVPAFSIVAGNPARVVKKIENDLDK